MCTNEVINKEGVLEVEYGEYPQMGVPHILNDILEEKYEKNKLKQTGKIYTICYDETTKKEFIEYEHKGERYIRVYYDKGVIIEDNPAGMDCLSHYFLHNEQAYWVKVEPIKWLVDEKKILLYLKKLYFQELNLEVKIIKAKIS